MTTNFAQTQADKIRDRHLATRQAARTEPPTDHPQPTDEVPSRPERGASC